MKGKAKKRDCRDINGIVYVSDTVLAFLMGAWCIVVMMRTWPLFYYPRQPNGHYQNNYKNRNIFRDSFFIYPA
jgi:hypothetical protein